MTGFHKPAVRRWSPVALTSVAALLTAFMDGPAQAQTASFNAGNPTVNSGSVSFDRGVTTPGTEVYTVNSRTAVLTFTPNDTAFQTGSPINFQNSGTTVRYTNGANTPAFTVLNRIVPADGSRPIEFNGRVISEIRAGNVAAPGGDVWFYSPGGIILGATAAFDVGSLLLTARDPTNGTGVIGSTNQMRVGGAAGSLIDIRQGASINATREGSYVALAAPLVRQSGTVRVNGGAGYVAAEDATLFVNTGLIGISVAVGTDSGNGFPLVHSGSTTGPASTGSTDPHEIRMVAVPKNTAITLLITEGSRIGFDVATVAGVQNGVVRLSSGRNTSDGFLLTTPNEVVTAADLNINGGVFTSDVFAAASTNAYVAATSGTASFSGNLNLQGGSRAHVAARQAGRTLTVGGNLYVSTIDGTVTSRQSGNQRVFDVRGGQSLIYTENGGSVVVGGRVDVRADAFEREQIGTGTLRGSATGGETRVTANGGSITFGGDTYISTFAYGGALVNSNADMRGGVTFLATLNGGTLTLNGANNSIIAGGYSSINALNSGNVFGGDVGINTVAGGGRIQIAGNAYVGAIGIIYPQVVTGGGTATGGRAAVSSNGGAISVGGTLSIDATAQAGAATNGAGGAAVGGLANLFANTGGAITVVGGTSVSASAFGGDVFGTAIANGGAGRGGTAQVNAFGDLNLQGQLSVTASGSGGDLRRSGTVVGGVGGAGVGGIAQLHGNTGRTTIGNGLFVSAGGFGGSALTDSAGGSGGEGGGGRASVEVFAATARIDVANGFVSINASGQGGAGLGAGSRGGAGFGGYDPTNFTDGARLYASGGGVISLAGTSSVVIGASGTGGTGAIGGAGSGGGAILQVQSGGTINSTRDISLSSGGSGGAGLAGQGGLGLGGNGFALASEGALNLAGLFVSTPGIGGSGTGGAGGGGQGGRSQAQGASGALTLTGNLSLTAVGIGGSGAGVGGDGGDGQGGAARLTTLNPTGRITVAGSTSVLASGTGGNALSGGSTRSGGGFGGATGTIFGASRGATIFAIAGAMDLRGGVALSTTGNGGTGGIGGLGQGGFSQFALSNGDVSVGGLLSVTASGFGGNNSGQAVADPLGRTGGAGVGGRAEVVTFTRTAGTGSMRLGGVNLSTSGVGGVGTAGTTGAVRSGGAGTGGFSVMSSSGSNIVVTGNVNLDAIANGGATDNGVAGTGTGGNAQLTTFAGSSISVSGTTNLSAFALGGAATGIAAGSGGAAIAGNATINSNGAMTLTGNVGVFATASGGTNARTGAAGGSGGAATGGRAYIVANTGTIAMGGDATVGATATGGSSTGSGGDGGAGSGGGARIDTIGLTSRLTLAGNATMDAGGRGGDGLGVGSRGGIGTGGSSDGTDNFVRGAYLFSGAGVTTVGGNVLVSATGNGGSGATGGAGIGGLGNIFVYDGSITVTGQSTGRVDGTGGNATASTSGQAGGVGGEGVGGEFYAGIAPRSGGVGTLRLGVLGVNANGIGGSGAAGIGGVGGRGGNATGGFIQSYATASSLALTTGDLFFSATAQGGAGGAGAAGFNGGAGGAAQGGAAQIGNQSNPDFPPNTGSAAFGNVSLITDATGGAGGAGGTGAIGGLGGAGTGGSSVILVRGVPVTVGTALMSSRGVGGAGSTGGAGSGGRTDIIASNRFQRTERGRLTTGAVTMVASGTGGAGTTTGAATSGTALVQFNGADGTLGGLDFTSAGATPTAPDGATVPTFQVDVVNGSVTVTGALRLTVAGVFNLNAPLSAQTISIASRGIFLGPNALLGGASTQSIVLSNFTPGGSIILGGDEEADTTYSISNAEFARLRANQIEIRGQTGQSGQSSVLVRNLSITGSAAGGASNLVGSNAEFRITGDVVRVEGAVNLRGAGATDTLSLIGGRRVEVVTDRGGLLSVTGPGTGDVLPLAGTLSLSGPVIGVGTNALLTQLAADPRFEGRNALLSAGPTTPVPAGYVQANRLILTTSNVAAIQNTGTAATFGGFTAGLGGLLVRAPEGTQPGSTPSQVVVYGRVQRPGGGFYDSTDVGGGAAFQTGQASLFDRSSTVNGCAVGASCGSEPAVIVATVSAIEEVLASTQAAAVEVPSIRVVQIVDEEELAAEPIIEEPVSGAGNLSLWDTAEDEDDEDDEDEADTGSAAAGGQAR